VSNYSFPNVRPEDDVPNPPRALPRRRVSAEHALGNHRLCCSRYRRPDEEWMPLERGCNLDIYGRYV
jgi:hypothetical protein